METSATIGAIAGAIVAVQSAIKPAEKDATNPAFRSKYATLLSVWDSCREALGKAGVAVVQTPTAAPAGHAALATMLIHAKSGEWIRDTVTSPIAKQDPQGVGSAITYLRRYSLAAALGIVADEDDDAAAASHKPGAPTPRTGTPGPAAVTHLRDLAATSSQPAPVSSPPKEGRVAATAGSYSDEQYQTFAVTRAYHDLKEGTRKDGKPFSFTKHSANTAEGLRIATLKDDFGVLLRDGATVEAVLAGEQKYGSYEILDLREVVEGGLTDVWPDTADLEI
jgi:hypothetical protein